jgi:hypothetical protein
MTDVRNGLEKAAEWQRRRKALSWPEKIRLAEAIRDSLIQLRRTRADTSPASSVRSENDGGATEKPSDT